MNAIFVNYRQNRRPSGLRPHAQVVEAVADRLRWHFGAGAVFLDTGMRAATRYPDELRERLAGSELVVAVIHREWLADLRDREGELDWVRHELATALEQGKPVLPVLLADARLPESGELPPELAELAKCQAHAVRFGQWEHDIGTLLAVIEGHVAAEALPTPEPDPRPRGRWRTAMAQAALAGAVVPVAVVHQATADRVVWLTALAVVLVALLVVAWGTAALVHALRKPIDGMDRAWTRRPGDERTNAVVGATIAGLAVIVLLTSDMPADLRLAALGVVVVATMGLATQWINHREKALAWPRAWLAATPSSIRGELAMVGAHLARQGPISRSDRDKAEYVLAQIADRLGAVRAQQDLRRWAWLRVSSPLVTLPHAALFGAALGTTVGAAVMHWQAGGPLWPALGWAAAGVVAAVGCQLGAVDTSYRLARWRRRAVLDTAPAELAALRELLARRTRF
ncbi:TIR domain-containing protein [Actinokineospora sp. 24-640]